MIRRGAVFRNGVKLWKLRQWNLSLGVIRFRIFWFRRSGHLKLRAGLLKGKPIHRLRFPLAMGILSGIDSL